MKIFFWLLLGLVSASSAPAGTRIEAWRHVTPRGATQREISFRLRKTKWGALNLHTLSVTQTAWTYFFSLKGDRVTFGPSELSVLSFVPREIVAGASRQLTIESGSVELDRSKNKLLILIRIHRAGKIESFEGNGEYAVSLPLK